MVIKVSLFAVAMLLVAAGLVVVFGDFRFGPESTYHATFIDASRLKAGQKVRISGVPVGSVQGLKLNQDNSVDVEFVDARADPVRKPGRRPVPGNHVGSRRTAEAGARRDDQRPTHRARTGSGCAAGRIAAGIQGVGC
jgi:hypothetical protein